MLYNTLCCSPALPSGPCCYADPGKQACSCSDRFLTPGQLREAINTSRSRRPTPLIGATSRLIICVRISGWSRRKLGVPRPELAHHILIELGVVEFVEPLERLAVEAVQFVPAVIRLVVGCSAKDDVSFSGT